MGLRQYQKDALQAVSDNYQAGVNKVLVVMATGLGKMVVAANLPEAIGRQKGEQIVFLAHRNELVDQAARQFKKFNPELSITIDRAHHRADLTGDIIVSSVPSIGRLDSSGNFPERLTRYNRDAIKYVLIDEAHRFPSNPMFLAPLRYFRVYKGEPDNCDNSKLLYANTATPNRHDKVGLEEICDKIVYAMDLRDGITAGWLVDLKGYRIETEVDLSGVRTSHGDFQTSDLERTVNTPERNNLIVEKYRELGNGQAGLAFTVDVQHSHDLASAFRKHGITAMPISGDTPESERKRLLEDHRSGKVKLLLSAGVLNEGVDCPHATVGLLTRPTRSTLLYIQQLGRLSRPYPAPEEGPPLKQHAVILDFVDLCAKHKLITLPTLFGLRADFDLNGSGSVEALEEIEEAQEKAKQLSLDSFKSLQALRSLVERIDLLKAPVISGIIRAHSRLAWYESTGTSFRLSIPDGVVLSIRENSLGGFAIAEHRNGIRRLILDNLDGLASAFQAADRMVPTEARRMLNMEARWRSDPPSTKQILRLAKLDRSLYSKFGSMDQFSEYINASFTKGDLSRMIDERTPHEHHH